MNKIQKISIFFVIALVSLGVVATQVEAHTPSVSVSQVNDNQVSINVYGESNTSVMLYYYGNSNLQSVGTIGTTNDSGYFSTTVNSNTYGIPQGATVYVIVNGQQSSSVTWPWYNNSYNNNNNNYNNTFSLST